MGDKLIGAEGKGDEVCFFKTSSDGYALISKGSKLKNLGATNSNAQPPNLLVCTWETTRWCLSDDCRDLVGL